MVLWSPQKRQEIFLSRFEDEALYGGAAGGGKSEALVVEALRQVHIPHYRALILRKTYPELSELIDKSQRYYRGAFPAAQWSEARHEWRFPSGAKISFGAMQHTNDRFKYQGRAYDYIAFDELTHFTQDEYLYLLSRNRASGPGTRVYLRASANPGGIGHGWVKARFLTPAPPMQTIWEDVSMLTPDGAVLNAKRSRIFVPSTVFDNQILLKNDPAYAARLAALPDADKRALLYGDWDAFAGQVFSEWRADPAHYADRRYVFQLMEEAGKKPVLVKKDVPGFLANRMQHALFREAISIVENGIAEAGDVDDAIKYGFGMRLGVSGPMEVIDRGGLDLTYSIHKYLFPHIESSAEPSKLMVQLMDEGKLGFKTGEGFQLWSPGQVKASNETLTRGLIQVSRALGRL